MIFIVDHEVKQLECIKLLPCLSVLFSLCPCCITKSGIADGLNTLHFIPNTCASTP